MKASIEEVFQSEGILARHLPRYELRNSQLEAAQAVAEAIESGRHLLIEAGTGTGKTLAYLIPALFSKRRVIVSTATRNLQEQIFFKDLPFIRRYLLPDVQVTYMKGRRNYLCLKKLQELGSPQLFERDRAQGVVEKLHRWASTTETGDRSELEWLEDSDPLWGPLDARSERCVGQKCDYFRDCFVTRMRQKAFESDIVIVNHALFFANLALESDEIGKVLPDFSVLILDEAHEIEDVAADFFGEHVSSYQVDDLCRDLGRFAAVSGEVAGRAASVEKAAADLFSKFPLQEGRHSLTFFRRPDGSVKDFRYELFGPFENLKQALAGLSNRLKMELARDADLEPLATRSELLSHRLDRIFTRDDPDCVYWFDRRGRGLFLHLTPIRVAEILQDRLFSTTSTVVLTSATLSANGSFDYIRDRLGITAAREVSVDSEFDFERQAVLYVPRDIPEPRSQDYFLHALREIRGLLEVTDGNAFILFTSFRQMERVHDALKRSGDYPLLCQGEQPKNSLLARFKETERAVLCATSSFWQGVDVQGDALRSVIIDKLPFAVPTEPIVAARLNQLKGAGEDPFARYSIPAATIALKQGLGRLIRSRRDQGVLAVLDSRLWHRRYGKNFFSSLPNCPVTDNIEELRDCYRRNLFHAESMRRIDD